MTRRSLVVSAFLALFGATLIGASQTLDTHKMTASYVLISPEAWSRIDPASSSYDHNTFFRMFCGYSVTTGTTCSISPYNTYVLPIPSTDPSAQRIRSAAGQYGFSVMFSDQYPPSKPTPKKPTPAPQPTPAPVPTPAPATPQPDIATIILLGSFPTEGNCQMEGVGYNPTGYLEWAEGICTFHQTVTCHATLDCPGRGMTCNVDTGVCGRLTPSPNPTPVPQPGVYSTCRFGDTCDHGYVCTAPGQGTTGYCMPPPPSTFSAPDLRYGDLQMITTDRKCLPGVYAADSCKQQLNGTAGYYLCWQFTSDRYDGTCLFYQNYPCNGANPTECPRGFSCDRVSGLCVQPTPVPGPEPSPSPNPTPEPAPAPTDLPVGATCRSNNECASGYCRAATATATTGFCATDTRCATTTDCSAKEGLNGTICVSGACLAACMKGGINIVVGGINFGCPEGTYCDNRRLCAGKGKAGDGCASSEHCLSGVCQNGRCATSVTPEPIPAPTPTPTPTPTPPPVPGTCATDAECGGKFCIDGWCMGCITPEPSVSTDLRRNCPEGTYCSRDQLCETKKQPGEACYESKECETSCTPDRVHISVGRCICDQDHACPDTHFCYNRGCTEKQETGAWCTSDEWCKSGACVNGLCANAHPAPTPSPTPTPLPSGCMTNDECAMGEYCTQGRCVVRKRGNEWCMNAAECVSNQCRSNFCTCKGNDDCTDGKICNLLYEYCQNQPTKKSVGEICTGASECFSNLCVRSGYGNVNVCGCSTTNDCDTGSTCDGSGLCIPTPSQFTCTSDAECGAQRCISGACTPCGPATWQCPAGFYCGSDGGCASQLNAGEVCTSATECASNICTPARSPALPNLCGCRWDNDCATGQICNAFTQECMTPQCSAPTDCLPLGQICKNNACEPCTPGGYDCPAGYTCTQTNPGKCMPAPVTTPTPECAVDPDCDLGKVCDQGRCVAGCANSEECDGNPCISGRCQPCSPQPGNWLSCTGNRECVQGQCQDRQSAPSCALQGCFTTSSAVKRCSYNCPYGDGGYWNAYGDTCASIAQCAQSIPVPASSVVPAVPQPAPGNGTNPGDGSTGGKYGDVIPPDKRTTIPPTDTTEPITPVPTASFCGNGIVESPERCDDGLANGTGGPCADDCMLCNTATFVTCPSGWHSVPTKGQDVRGCPNTPHCERNAAGSMPASSASSSSSAANTKPGTTCFSSKTCAPSEICTTELGECHSACPPGAQVCMQVCAGTCVPRTENCIAEGDVVAIVPNRRPCCTGLTEVGNARVGTTGMCIMAQGTALCTKCGDGKCGTGENVCNCPKDCEKLGIPPIQPLTTNPLPMKKSMLLNSLFESQYSFAANPFADLLRLFFSILR